MFRSDKRLVPHCLAPVSLQLGQASRAERYRTARFSTVGTWRLMLGRSFGQGLVDNGLGASLSRSCLEGT